MRERLLLAGSGGQGMLLVGKLLATAAMHHQLEVTYLPSYGTEVRGGTAHCTVIVSDEPIYSPVADQLDSLLVMNQASFDRFVPMVRPGGLIVADSSMIDPASPAPGGQTVFVPATETANQLGNLRVANMVLLGAYLARRELAPRPTVLDALAEAMAGKNPALLALNEQALARGSQLAQAT